MFEFYECPKKKCPPLRCPNIGEFRDEETNECNFCPSGYYCPDRKYKIPCPEGTVTSDVREAKDMVKFSSCQYCPKGYYPSNDKDECIMSPAGKYILNYKPTECPSGTYSGKGFEECSVTCPPSYFTDDKYPNKCIKKCEKGYYYENTNDYCLSCYNNYTTEKDNSIGIESCKCDKYLDTFGNCAIDECPIGFFLDNKSCKRCPPGTTNISPNSIGIESCDRKLEDTDSIPVRPVRPGRPGPSRYTT